MIGCVILGKSPTLSEHQFFHASQPFSFFSFLKKLLLFILFLAALGLRCCVQDFSGCGEQGLLFVAVCGLLIVVASLVAEHGL